MLIFPFRLFPSDIANGVFRVLSVPKSSTKITLGVSKGSPPDYYIVPDLINLSFDRATDLIYKSGLRIGEIEYEYQPQLLNNTVIDQSMTPGLRVSFPASINLIVTNDRIIEESE